MAIDFITTESMSLRYDVIPGTGPLVVLVHEMGGSLESWDLVMPSLSGIATLRFDLPGFGLSEKPTKSLELNDIVVETCALINNVTSRRSLVLVGSAFGAAVALECAGKLGERVSGFIGFAPAFSVPPERSSAVLEMATLFEREGFRDFFWADTAPKAWPADIIPRDKGFDLFCATQLSTPPASLAATYRILATMDVSKRLEALTCSALLVSGQHDGARPRSVIEPLSSLAPNGAYREISSGHFMALQSPQIVARIIREVVAKID